MEKRFQTVSTPKNLSPVKEFLKEQKIEDLEFSNKQWSKPQRDLMNKKTLKLPQIIAENYDKHQFGKPSVRSDQARKLIINEFNREYIENQQVKQANY